MSKPDKWLQGYAAALAQIWSLHHDGQMVEQLLIGSGIKVYMLAHAGAEPLDLQAIENALASRGKAAL